MKKIMKHGVLALALLGGAALFAAPAVANSLHDEGDFGGGYRITVAARPDLSAALDSILLKFLPRLPMSLPARADFAE